VKTASAILGIAGGALDGIIALVIMIFGRSLAGLFISAGGLQGMEGAEYAGSMITGAVVFVGFLVLLVGALAITGGLVAKKNATVGGILMLAAGVLNFFLDWVGALIALILIVGGVLSLIVAGEAKKAAPPAPAA
jgi:hypothetical protein